jgi:uncharacterized protein (DUF2141 family)
MRRRSLLLALAALPVVSLGTSAAEAQDPVRGTLEQVDTGRGAVVIRTEAGPRTGRISAETRVTVHGMPGDARDLRPGQTVVARFAMTRGGQARDQIVQLDVVPASRR